MRVADFLLITDKPHIRKVFRRLAEDHNLPLRVASSLEDGGRELTASKPAMVFVQTHLSGLSADIIHMHLKKLLGRRRTRFVLLAPPDQISENVVKLYHDCIDISLDEQELLEAIGSTITSLATRNKKTGTPPETAATALPPAGETAPAATLQEPAPEDAAGVLPRIQPSRESKPETTAGEETAEPSLEEQGVVYAPKPQKAVYSEFTSAFESAVSEISTEEPAPVSRLEQPDTQVDPRVGEMHAVPQQPRSMRTTFMVWLAPLLLVVVAITAVQYYLSKPRSAATISLSPPKPAGKPAIATAVRPGTVNKPGSTTTTPGRVAETAPATGAAQKTMARAPLPAPVDQRGAAAQAPSSVPRPTAIPAFIPRNNPDRGYGTANPGWERYRGGATEFKVFREGGAIRAIQVIDQGGNGIPETFMKGAIGQLAGNASISPASSEKKEEYLIQRAQVAKNLNAIFYRDARGGKLRAFVVTWQ